MQNLKNKDLKEQQNKTGNKKLQVVLVISLLLATGLSSFYFNNKDVTANKLLPVVVSCSNTNQTIYSYAYANETALGIIRQNATWYSNEYDQFVRQKDLSYAIINMTNCNIKIVKSYKLYNSYHDMEITW